MAFNRNPTPTTTSPLSPMRIDKRRILIAAAVLFLTILLICNYVSLRRENNILNDINGDLKNQIDVLLNKNSDLRINLKEMNGFYDKCIETSRKTEKKLKKTKYFHHMLHVKSKKFIAELKKKINGFQLKGDCDLLTMFRNTYDKFSEFFNNHFSKSNKATH